MRKQIIKSLGILSIIALTSCTSSKPTTGTIDNQVNSSINRDNYYGYYKATAGIKPVVTNWVRRDEAVQVIANELNALGLKTSTYVLYELPEGNRIILDVYNRDNDFSFIYSDGHIASVKKEQREITQFSQDVFKYGGRFGKSAIYDTLPENIAVLQETWYWYQTTEDENVKDLLNKETALEILRQDVRAVVSK